MCLDRVGPRCMCLWFCTFVCVAVTVVTFMTVFREYYDSRSFIETQCYSAGEVHHGKVECEVCTHSDSDGERECRDSEFPCVALRVSYTAKDGSRHVGTLHPSAIQMSEYPDCSYSVCKLSSDYNTQRVEEFLQAWIGRNNTTCYYNPDSPTQVLTELRYSRTQALHAVCWPAGFALLALSAAVLVCCARVDSGETLPCSGRACECSPCSWYCADSCCPCECCDTCCDDLSAWVEEPCACCARGRERKNSEEVCAEETGEDATREPFLESPATRQRAATAPLPSSATRPGNTSPTDSSPPPPPMMESLSSDFSDSHPGLGRPGYTPPPSYEHHTDYRRPAPSAPPAFSPPTYHDVLTQPEYAT